MQVEERKRPPFACHLMVSPGGSLTKIPPISITITNALSGTIQLTSGFHIVSIPITGICSIANARSVGKRARILSTGHPRRWQIGNPICHLTSNFTTCRCVKLVVNTSVSPRNSWLNPSGVRRGNTTLRSPSVVCQPRRKTLASRRRHWTMGKQWQTWHL